MKIAFLCTGSSRLRDDDDGCVAPVFSLKYHWMSFPWTT